MAEEKVDEKKKEESALAEAVAEEVAEKKEDSPAEAKADEPGAQKAEDKPAEDSKKESKAEKAPVETKAEEKKEESVSAKATTDAVAEAKPEPSGKFKDLIKQVEEMSVSDLAELVKALEDRFGVSAAAPMAVAAAGGGAVGAAPEAEEKSNYTVMLKDAGAQKIAVIKAVREVNQDLGLVEAKNLVDGAPKEIKKDVPKADAEEVKKKLEAAGATVELV